MAVEYATLGTDTSGRTARACPHWGATWPWIVRWWAVRYPGEHPLEIIQALGTATVSAGTHGAPGTALDLRSWRYDPLVLLDLLRLLRAAGADASWYRTKAQGFDPHVHGALDCPCQSPADYQIAAVRAGYNGLGSGGRGGKDDGPAISGRGWADGLTWLMGEVKRLEEDDMPSADEIAAAVWNGSTWGGETAGDRLGKAARAAETAALQTRAISRGGLDVALRQEVADSKTMLIEQSGLIRGLTEAVAQLAGGGSVDLASVEAAAKRGAQEALRGATVSVDLGGGAA